MSSSKGAVFLNFGRTDFQTAHLGKKHKGICPSCQIKLSPGGDSKTAKGFFNPIRFLDVLFERHYHDRISRK
jgi:hypothetical protein